MQRAHPEGGYSAVELAVALEPEPRELEIIRRIFTGHADGQSLREIAGRSNDERESPSVMILSGARALAPRRQERRRGASGFPPRPFWKDAAAREALAGLFGLSIAASNSAAREMSSLTRQLVVYTRWLIVLTFVLIALGGVQMWFTYQSLRHW